MWVSFKVGKKIEDLFVKNELLWASEISNILWLSRTIVHIALKELVIEKKIKKIGKWPRVRYKSLIVLYNNEQTESDIYNPDFKTQKLLWEIFYKFTPNWEILKWFDWIKKWCYFRKLDLEEKIENYIKINTHVESLQDSCWLLLAWDTFWKHFEKVYLDEVYYSDQYKRMEFGRGKLAEKTFYAKQSQRKDLIQDVNDEIFLKLNCIIKNNNFDAIAITPWSIDRTNQLLWLLKNKLEILNLPFIKIIKYYPNNITIPQKSLKTREQRIENAKNTIFVNDKDIKKYNNVFLIDDFVGSGSTLNETAKKLKEKWVQKVVWFAYVWNMNLSYEVINEI